MELLAYLNTNPLAFAGICLFLGLLAGSFLNVVCHRLPIMLERSWQQQLRDLAASTPPSATPTDAANDPEYQPPDLSTSEIVPGMSTVGTRQRQPRELPGPDTLAPFNLFTPRSHCPRCQHPIRARHNIPLFSYLLLRGTCANCNAPVSPQYPLVELTTALLTALFAWHFGASWYTLAALALVWTLIPLAIIDLKHQLLPDQLTLPLLWLGLLVHSSSTLLGLPICPPESTLLCAPQLPESTALLALPNLLPGEHPAMPDAISWQQQCPGSLSPDRHHRGRCRLYDTMALLLALQTAHRQGGHGLWRFQIARRPRGLAGLAKFGTHLAAGICNRRRVGPQHDRLARPHPQHAHPVRLLPGRRRTSGTRHRFRYNSGLVTDYRPEANALPPANCRECLDLSTPNPVFSGAN